MREPDRQPTAVACLPLQAAGKALPGTGEGAWLPRWYNLDIVLTDDFPRA